MEQNTIKQFQNIIDSLTRIMEKQVSDEKIKVACTINHCIEQAEKWGWSPRYIDALEDLKKHLGMKNTIYELYRS